MLPDEIELACMKPFAPVPDPPFLLTQRIKKRKIYINKSFELSRVKKDHLISQSRNSNTQVPPQSLLWKKIGKLDEYLEEHNMKVYKRKLLEL